MRKITSSVVLSIGVVLVAAAVAAAVGGIRRVSVEDRCDPETFNAALGEGACVEIRGDTVTFDEFLAALLKGGHSAWRFKSKSTEARVGDTVRAANVGGELHTFTEVAAFGGGFVPELNEPLGLTTVPECDLDGGTFDPATFVAAGASLDVSGLAQGTHHFQCCIHPWMRTEVRVKK
jgi:plastocyanin